MFSSLSYNLFKNKDFFKILKTEDDLNYLEKFVEQLVEKWKKHFFCDVTKVDNFDKNVLLYRKRTKKVRLNIFASVDQNPQ
jgi:hypothetical protein